MKIWGYNLCAGIPWKFRICAEGMRGSFAADRQREMVGAEPGCDSMGEALRQGKSLPGNAPWRVFPGKYEAVHASNTASAAWGLLSGKLWVP